jgi:hypothetical protein
MTQGAKYWFDKDRLYIQDNNAIETLVPGLEYCGPSAMINCIAALRDLENTPMNDYGGRWEIQPEDYATAYFIDQRNVTHFKRIRGDVDFRQYPPNRIPQYYPTAALNVFAHEARYCEGGTFETIAKLLWEGNAVQLCIKSPGHYIAALAYDSSTMQIGFKDPWAGDRWPGGNTLADQNNNKWFDKDAFNDDEHGVQHWYIVYNKI